MMIETGCAICGPNVPYKILYPEKLNFKDFDSELFAARKTPKGLHYRIARCDQCNLVFSNPILPDLEKFYQKSSFAFEPDLKNAKATYLKILKKVCKKLNQKKALLEIGCSNGFILEAAKELGFHEVFGIEPNEEAVRHAREDIKKNIHIGILKEGLYADRQFDLICAFHLFDHLSHPNDFLTLCHRYLKDDGYLLFVHHNVQSPFVKIFKDRSPVIDVVHPYLYEKTTQKKILEKNHFSVIKIFNVYDCYSLVYWTKLLPISDKQKQFFLNFLRSLKIDRFKMKIPVGNMGVVAQKWLN